MAFHAILVKDAPYVARTSICDDGWCARACKLLKATEPKSPDQQNDVRCELFGEFEEGCYLLRHKACMDAEMAYRKRGKE